MNEQFIPVHDVQGGGPVADLSPEQVAAMFNINHASARDRGYSTSSSTITSIAGDEPMHIVVQDIEPEYRNYGQGQWSKQKIACHVCILFSVLVGAIAIPQIFLIPSAGRSNVRDIVPALKLIGSEAIGQSRQGNNVAISEDGNEILIVGENDANQIGALWAFTRKNCAQGWCQRGPKIANVSRVAMSGDGQTCVIGTSVRNTFRVAIMYGLNLTSGFWEQQSPPILPNESSSLLPTLGFGDRLSITRNGSMFITGATKADDALGCAYIFERSGSNGPWIQAAKLIGVGGPRAFSPNQGSSVALSADGSTAAMGALTEDTGATYVFIRLQDRSWEQQARLVGKGGIGLFSAAQGSHVVLSPNGNVLAVSGPFDDASVGAVWVFTRVSGIWDSGIKLVPYSTYLYMGFHTGVAFCQDGKRMRVGGAGNGVMFFENNGGWKQTKKNVIIFSPFVISASQPLQGYSLACSANCSVDVVGGPFEDNQSGATWIVENIDV